MKKGNIDKTDWGVAGEDFDTAYAKILSKNPKRLKAFKQRIIKDYNKTKNIQLFLLNLRIIAMAERKMSELAKVAKIERSSVYKILSKRLTRYFIQLYRLRTI